MARWVAAAKLAGVNASLGLRVTVAQGALALMTAVAMENACAKSAIVTKAGVTTTVQPKSAITIAPATVTRLSRASAGMMASVCVQTVTTALTVPLCVLSGTGVPLSA